MGSGRAYKYKRIGEAMTKWLKWSWVDVGIKRAYIGQLLMKASVTQRLDLKVFRVPVIVRSRWAEELL